MEFRNLTPFDAMCFASVDAQDKPFNTVVMRVGYRLAVDSPSGRIELAPLDEEPVPLCMEDEYFGAINASSLKWESDLAPYKPACDLIVLAHAHAPAGKPARRVAVRCELQRPDQVAPLPEKPQGLNPYMAPSQDAMQAWREQYASAQQTQLAGDKLLDKTLLVTGAREFRRRWFPLPLLFALLRWLSLGLLALNPWRLTRPHPFSKQPLRYEYAWGGQCRIDAGERVARRVPKKYRLTPAQAAGHPDQAAPPEQRAIAHEANEANPLGRGFTQAWFVAAKRSKRLAAPQIERAGAAISARQFWRALRSKPAAPKPTDPLAPAGLGAIGRAWLPRRTLAGTYDQRWLDERHPWLPHDFDFAYWNCAPADQQLPYLFGDEHLAFSNLVPHDTPGATRDEAGNTRFAFSLPRHRAFVLTRWHNGLLLPLPLRIDTLIVNLDQMQIEVVWRLVLPDDAPLRVIEARFEIDPAAPLVTLDPTTSPATEPKPAHV